jgi:hypothetical protein
MTLTLTPCTRPTETLTGRDKWREVGRDLGQCVPAAGAARQGLLSLMLLLQARALPGLLTDGRVQQATGGDGAVLEHSITAGIHREEQGLYRRNRNQ